MSPSDTANQHIDCTRSAPLRRTLSLQTAEHHTHGVHQMTPSLKDVLPLELAEHIEELIKDSPYISTIEPHQVRSLRHNTRWLDPDVQRNIQTVLGDPLFGFQRRLSAYKEKMRLLTELGAAGADEALQELEGMGIQLKALVTRSAVRMFEQALPILGYTRTYKKLNRLAKLGPTRAKQKGRDYPPHMYLPDYGLISPEVPDGAYYPEPTGIANEHIDCFIRSTANHALMFMNARMEIEKSLHNERRCEERRLRRALNPAPRRGKKSTVHRASIPSSPPPMASTRSLTEASRSDRDAEGIVAKNTPITRTALTAGQTLSRPRLDKAGIPAKWGDLTDFEKCNVISEAVHAHTSGISITADIDVSWMASRKAAGKDISAEIQQRLAIAFKDVVGPGIAFAAVIEADRLTKPHLHGLVSLPPTLENRRLVRTALLRFTGEYDLDGKARARRVDAIAFDGSPRWAAYPFKYHASARKTVGTHRVLIYSHPAVRLGRALQEQRRAAALSSPG